MKNTNKIITLYTLIFLLSPISSKANELDLSSKEITQLNHFSPVESASSHGSIGYNLGVGLQQTRDYNGYTLSAGRIFVTRGFDIPLDLGFSLGTIMQSPYTLLSFYGQYSIFEKFKWPSLSLRAAFSSIIGSDNPNNSFEFSTVASYGFLRYFNIFSYLSLQRSLVQSLPLGLNLMIESKAQERISYDMYFAYGIEIKLINPLYKLSIESSENMREEKSLLIKLGHGF